MALEQLFTAQFGVDVGIRHAFMNNSETTLNFECDGHKWSFYAGMRAKLISACGCSDTCLDALAMTLTYGGTTTDSEHVVEAFGRIYLLNERGYPTTQFSHKILRRQFGLDKKEIALAQKEAARTIVPLMVKEALSFRIQLYIVKKACIPIDHKVLKPHATLAITVGETKLHASKEILASASPVFSTMIYTENKNEITLSDVKSEEFQELLNVLQPGSRMELSQATAAVVLKVAHKYRMQSIVAICESRIELFCDGNMSLADRKTLFNIACECGLARLQQKLIMTCPLKELPPLLDESPVDPKSKEVLTMVLLRLIVERNVHVNLEESASIAPCDFKTSKPFANFVISVGGTKLYTSKEILASASSVFAAMLFGNFEDAKKNEITIEDFTVEEVELLLAFLQPGSLTTVNNKNVMGLLKLANKYLVESALAVCDDFLAADYLGEKTLMASHMYLVVASQYNLRSLQSIFAGNCDRKELVALLESGQHHSLTADALRRVVDRLWSGTAGIDLKTWSNRAASAS